MNPSQKLRMGALLSSDGVDMYDIVSSSLLREEQVVKVGRK